MSGPLNGYFDLTDWGAISLQGKDARDFLQRMSTVNFKNFDRDSVVHGAFLTGRGTVIALGLFAQVGPETFEFIVDSSQIAKVLEHVEMFHFAEVFASEDRSARHSFFALRGGGATETFSPLKRQPFTDFGVSCEAWRDDDRPELLFVKVPRDQASAFRAGATKAGVPLLEATAFENLRIERAVPAVGKELSDKDIILEANYDKAVARNKGCYPGQEVVERIFTYGQVNKKLFPVTIDSAGDIPPVPFPISAADPKAGTVVSVAKTPDDARRTIGLAYINRKFWETNEFNAAGGESKPILISRRQ